MTISQFNENGLKGQYTKARGNRRRRVALGLRRKFKVVRVKLLDNERINVRTKWSNSDFELLRKEL